MAGTVLIGKMAKYDLAWLASYPKSGNTWLRSFFSALCNRGNFDINKLEFNEIFADKYLFSLLVKKNISDFDEHQLEIERRRLLDFYLKTKKLPYLLKIHDQFKISSHDNLPIFHTQIPTTAIYIIRNPFDVTLSFSRYLGISIDEIIDNYVCKAGSTIYMDNRFPRQIGTWQEHVMSWKQQNEIPVKFIRYEDLKAKPYESFRGLLSFLELEFPENEINDAIDKSDFKKLKKMERNEGFRERLLKDVPFFFTGETLEGEKNLTQAQKKRIINNNLEAMSIFGYL